MSIRKQSTCVNRSVVALLALAVLFVGSATASAQLANKKTTVTFNEPVEIPGVNAQVLPAGVYVFKLLDSLSDRHIVQVFNKDESHIYATILAIPNYRLRATDKTVMTFAERAAGDPQAIRAWFYPGDNWGQEFVYPKKRALQLAKVTNLPVLYIPDELAPNLVAPVRTADDAPVVALKNVPLRAVRPTGEDVEIAAVIEAPPQQVARLPKTASTLPAFFLAGLLLMGAAFALKTSCARS
jgi:hypothetical protein